MRIIVSGSDREYQLSCGCCGCLFAYRGGDVRRVNAGEWQRARAQALGAPARLFQGKMPETMPVVDCPECGSTLRVPERAGERMAAPRQEGWWDE